MVLRKLPPIIERISLYIGFFQKRFVKKIPIKVDVSAHTLKNPPTGFGGLNILGNAITIPVIIVDGIDIVKPNIYCANVSGIPVGSNVNLGKSGKGRSSGKISKTLAIAEKTAINETFIAFLSILF